MFFRLDKRDGAYRPKARASGFLRRVRETHSRLELSHFGEAGAQRPRSGEGRLRSFAEGESRTRLVGVAHWLPLQQLELRLRWLLIAQGERQNNRVGTRTLPDFSHLL